MSKALVLHSGGVDSSTCLAIAMKAFDEIISVSANYGQRHLKEINYAKELCDHYGVAHEYFTLPDMPTTMLTDPDSEIPDASYANLPDGISPTYVPFRNGLLLSRIASIAQASEADAIFFGAHAEDAQNWAYPDCTPEFIGAMANAIFIGTYQKTRLHTPLMWMKKYEIIQLGSKLGVPWKMTWSCYKGEDLHCGICPTCRARKEAFRLAGIADPTEYAQ